MSANIQLTDGINNLYPEECNRYFDIKSECTSPYTIMDAKARILGKLVLFLVAINNGTTGIPMQRINAITFPSTIAGLTVHLFDWSIKTRGNCNYLETGHTSALDVPGFCSGNTIIMDVMYSSYNTASLLGTTAVNMIRITCIGYLD